MRERPILFSASMIRALLDGSKTQTRRVVKPTTGKHTIERIIATPDSLAAFIRHRCPYGAPGDRLWMPRAASRITLEIESVRVERLQDISEADVAAEGVPCYVCDGPMDGTSENDCHCFHMKATASDYRNLWELINGPGSWDANPWVWVVSFSRVKP